MVAPINNNSIRAFYCIINLQSIFYGKGMVFGRNGTQVLGDVRDIDYNCHNCKEK